MNLSQTNACQGNQFDPHVEPHSCKIRNASGRNISEDEIMKIFPNSHKSICTEYLAPHQSSNRYQIDGVPIIPKPCRTLFRNINEKVATTSHEKSSVDDNLSIFSREAEQTNSFLNVRTKIVRRRQNSLPLMDKRSNVISFDTSKKRINHSSSPDKSKIAREWQEYWDEEVEANYYYNELTGEASWVYPMQSN